MHAILLALLGAAFLIERVEFHHAARQVGVVAGFDLEAEAGAADPVNPPLAFRGRAFQLAGLRVAAFAERIAHGSRDALPGFEAGDHGLIALCGFARRLIRLPVRPGRPLPAFPAGRCRSRERFPGSSSSAFSGV